MFRRPITTAEKAFERFVRALERVARGKKPTAVASDDQAIARFVTQRPGELEVRLAAEAPALAKMPCPRTSYPSMLGYILNEATPDSTTVWKPPALPKTFSSFQPSAFLRFYAAGRRQPADRLGEAARHNSVHLASWFALRAGVETLDTLGLAPEQRDAVRAAATKEPLPNILPDDLSAFPPADIAGALSDYAGVSVEELEARMRPGGMSSAGFLADGESLGQVIYDDVSTLARLGVSRHEIADRIESIITGDALDGSITCEGISSAGHQEDPFHSSDIYGFTLRGASVYTITNEAAGSAAKLTLGDMVVVLIRRACFFEGATPYRVDPAHAARVLGLSEADVGSM